MSTIIGEICLIRFAPISLYYYTRASYSPTIFLHLSPSSLACISFILNISAFSFRSFACAIFSSYKYFLISNFFFFSSGFMLLNYSFNIDLMRILFTRFLGLRSQFYCISSVMISSRDYSDFKILLFFLLNSSSILNLNIERLS